MKYARNITRNKEQTSADNSFAGTSIHKHTKSASFSERLGILLHFNYPIVTV